MRKDFDAGASYGIISGDMSYDEMHDKAKSELQVINAASSDKYAKNWATTTLTSQGLQAYLHCQGGLQMGFESFDDQGGKVMLDWAPPPAFGTHHPLRVAMADNVKNRAEIENLLKSQISASPIQGFEIYVSKKEPLKAAELTVSTAGFSQTVSIPPAPPPVTERQADFSVNEKADSCDSGGNDDAVFCNLFETTVKPVADGDIKIMPHLKLQIDDDGKTADPHRWAYVMVQCDDLKTISPALGERNVKTAKAEYSGRSSCVAKKDQQVKILVKVNPRGGSSVVATGGIKISTPLD